MNSTDHNPYYVRNFVLLQVNTLFASASVWITGVALAAGPFLSLYVRQFTKSDLVSSLVPVLYCAASLTALAASWLAERIRHDQKVTTISLALVSVLSAACGSLPLIPGLSSTFCLVGLMTGVFLADVLVNLYFFSMFAWFPDLVGERKIGTLQGVRVLMFWCMGAVAPKLAGYWLDLCPSPQGFAVLYLAAGIFGLLGIVPLMLVRGHPTAPRPKTEHEPFFAAARQMMSDRDFRVFLLLVLVYNASAFFTGAYVNVFLRETLQLEYAQVGTVLMLSSAAAMATTVLWGRAVDRLGGRVAVLIGVVGGTVGPLLASLCAPGHVGLVYPAQVLGGGLGTAYSIGWVQLMYAMSPRHKRATAMALIWLAAAAGGLVMPFAGGALANWLGAATFHVGDRVYHNLNLLLLVQALIAAGAVPLAMWIRIPGQATLREAFGLFARHPLRALWLGLHGDSIEKLVRRDDGAKT